MSSIQLPAHVLTTGDVARLLACAPRTVAKWIDEGQLAGWRIPGSQDRRTSLALLAQFAFDHQIPLNEIAENRARQLDADGLPVPRGLRSHHWPVVQRAHLAAHPLCEACGAKKLLNVHHKQPFHEFPELELVDTNLITLCESPSHNCHLIFGHLLSWKSWNVDVENDAAAYRAKLANRPSGSDPSGPPPAAKSIPNWRPLGAHAALDEAETRRAA